MSIGLGFKASCWTFFAVAGLMLLNACTIQSSNVVAEDKSDNPQDVSAERPSVSPSEWKADATPLTHPLDGQWKVIWCDKERPQLDCGGFNLGLVQTGDKLCGSYNSARMGLSQVDEGGLITGVSEGDTSTLKVEGGRGGGKYVVKVSVKEDTLHWQLIDTPEEPQGDVDIIAIDEILERRVLEGEVKDQHMHLSNECRRVSQ